MSLNLTETAEAARPPRPASRPNGQWKVDGTAPLNGNEEWKQQDNGLNVRERIEKIYSKGGFDSIDGTDLHGRFRWWGLYTQRKPGIDGGKTATLEPHELEDEYFMLRVRIDGGQLTTEQLRVIGEHLRASSAGTPPTSPTGRTSSCTGSEVEDVPEIWRRLEAVGLGTTEACGDVPRVVLGSPVAGIAVDELIDPTAAIDEITAKYIGDAGAREPAPQVQDRDDRAPEPGRRARDQRRRLRGRRAPRTRHRLRPVGRRRPLGQPAPRRAPRRLRHPRPGRRRLARRRSDLPRLRLPAPAQQGPAQVPARRLGAGEVPAGARGRVPRLRRCPTARPRRPRPARATTSACTSRRTDASTSA